MKRLPCISIVCLVIFCIFSGCSEKKTDTAGIVSVESSAESSVLSTEDVLFLNSDNESVYRIVRPAGDTEATSVAQLLYKQMKSALGVNIRNVSDEEDGTDMYEILIGDCDRAETEVAKAYLNEKTGGRYEDHMICTVGKKIVVYSQSSESLKIAVEQFVVDFLRPEGVAGGIEYIYAVPGDFENITVNGVPIGRFTIVREHYNASYLTQLELEELTAAVFERTGYRVDIVHDAYTEPSNYEIIVGNADREGVEVISDYDEYRITVVGSKIYLNGGSAHATAMAVSEFGKLLNGDITDKNSAIGSYETALESYDKTATLYKTWGDDFDGYEIDTTVWRVGDPTSRDQGLNGKTQLRSSDPNDVFVADGKFYICGREDENYYYGGIIQTYGDYKYGYVEMSSVIPHGTGFWTALYLCSQDTYSVLEPDQPLMANPEYDVMECFGNSEHYQANIHSWPSAGGVQKGWEHISLDSTHGNEKRYRSVDTGVVLGHDFHTYGMMWDNEKVTFTCDADPFFTYDTTTNEQDIETNNHSVWLRIAMNVGNDSNPEPGITENPDDVYVADGKFYICARDDGEYYYGGMIRTSRTMSYKYGYAEMSSIIPQGDSFWIAWWACSNDSVSSLDPSEPKIMSPEIDIVECFGNSSYYAANCHSWPTTYGKNQFGYEHTSLDGATYGSDKKYTSVDEGVVLGDDFHTYGFLWDNTQMGFTCDGDLFFTYDTTTKFEDVECFNHSMYFIFSMALGFADAPGNPITEDPVEWAETNKLVLDWMNLYQKDDGLCELTVK